MNSTITTYTIDTSGQTITFDPATELYPDTIILAPDGSTTLLNDVNVSFANDPPAGTIIRIGWKEGFTLNSNKVELFGVQISQDALNHQGFQVFEYIDNAGNYISYTGFTLFDFNGGLTGALLTAGTVSLAKLVSGTSAQVIVVNGSGVPAYVAMSGDIAITNAGVTSIAAGAIVNADVNASAAIARAKLGTGTANYVLINDGSGNFSEEAQLAKSRGGFGQSVAASNGFAKFASGTVDISATSFTLSLLVSFEAAGGTAPSVGDFKLKMSGAGTVTEIYAYAVSAIAGTNNGTIIAKDAALTTMTSGTITFTAGDVRGTAYTVTPSANNAFVDGDILTFTTAKGTAGGLVQLSIKISRTS